MTILVIAQELGLKFHKMKIFAHGFQSTRNTKASCKNLSAFSRRFRSIPSLCVSQSTCLPPITIPDFGSISAYTVCAMLEPIVLLLQYFFGGGGGGGDCGIVDGEGDSEAGLWDR